MSISLEEEKKIIREISKGKKNFKLRDLTDINLHGQNLHRVDFSHANLEGADLRNTNLKEANLYNANLKGATLSGSNLQNAHAALANFEFTNLSCTCMIGINAPGARFVDADLFNSNLKEANLSESNFTGADLSSCIFSKARIKLANFENTVRQAADFSDCSYRVFDGPDNESVVASLNGYVSIGENIHSIDRWIFLAKEDSKEYDFLEIDGYLTLFKRIRKYIKEQRWPYENFARYT